MSTSFHPKHLLPETPTDTIRRLSIEGEVTLVEELQGNAVLHRALAENLRSIRGLIERGETRCAVEHMSSCIQLLEEWWVQDSLIVQEHGERLSEQLS